MESLTPEIAPFGIGTMLVEQGGDPAKLANALVQLVALQNPPVRFAGGVDAMQTFEAKGNALLAHGRANSELSASLAYK